MQVFNQHKAQMMQAIDQKIAKIDQTCSHLSNQIYQYSDERLRLLQKQRDEETEVIQNLKKTKQANNKDITDLNEQLLFLADEQQSIMKKIQDKVRDNQVQQRQLVFCEQKNKDETPHIQQYLSELSIAQKSTCKVQYAKNRLKELELKYRKQCQSVQQKYYQIQSMRAKLTQIRYIPNNISKYLKDTANSHCDPSPNHLHPTSLREETEFSQIQGSAISSYPEEHV